MKSWKLWKELLAVIESWKEVQEIIKARNKENLGFSDILDINLTDSKVLFVRQIGGGIFISRQNSINPTVIHLFPHSGCLIPIWCQELFINPEPEIIATGILENYDRGTTEIMLRLVEKMQQTPGDSTVLAYFNISRILIEANRFNSWEQVSGEVYTGQPLLCKNILNQYAERLRNEYLLPWLNEVNNMIRHVNCEIVMHHHTFDEYGKKQLSHDLKPFQQRPASQFFKKKPTLTQPDNGISSLSNNSFIQSDLLSSITMIAQNFLSKMTSNPIVEIDNPYIAPSLPFEGCIDTYGDRNDKPKHIIYEVRKDIISNKENIDHWMDCIETLIKIAQTSSMA